MLEDGVQNKQLQKELLTRVIRFCRENRLLEQDDRILVGVSGGADSVCLLCLLQAMRRELPFALRVVHVHHGIRAGADADQAYVEALCKAQHLTCIVFRENIPALAEQSGMSEEEAGREVRYRDFEQARQDWIQEECTQLRPDMPRAAQYKIATAHHQDDQAETILFRLLRGSGLTGLCGIRPVRDQIIRPLLCVSRVQIEGYLRAEGIPYVTDETNLENRYSRNKIRNRLLPFADREICHGAAAHIAAAGELLLQTEQYIRRAVEKACETLDCCRETGAGLSFSRTAFTALDPYLQPQVLLHLLEEMHGEGRKDLTARHIEQLLELLRGRQPGGHHADLPGEVAAECAGDRFYLYDRPDGLLRLWCREKKLPLCCVQEEQPEIVVSSEPAWTQEALAQLPQRCRQEPSVIRLDADLVHGSLFLRHRQPGDRFAACKDGGHKLLQDFLTGEKMPSPVRDRLWLLADDSGILWVPGSRMRADCAVTEKTTHTSRISLRSSLAGKAVLR